MTTDKKNRNEELKRTAPRLAALLQRQNPFRIPEGYFEENIKKLSLLTAETSAPGFAEGGKPFRLPEDYFENLDKRILWRIKESEESGESELPKEYFETLPGKIINRIHEEEKAGEAKKGAGRIRMIRSRAVRALAAAAVLAGLVLSYGILTRQSSEEKVIAGLNSVSTAELESYLTDQLEHLDEEELNTVIDPDESLMPDYEKELINEDELQDFILEDMDITTIEDIL